MTINTGNDQVSVDVPRKPLVAAAAAAAGVSSVAAASSSSKTGKTLPADFLPPASSSSSSGPSRTKPAGAKDAPAKLPNRIPSSSTAAAASSTGTKKTGSLSATKAFSKLPVAASHSKPSPTTTTTTTAASGDGITPMDTESANICTGSTTPGASSPAPPSSPATSTNTAEIILDEQSLLEQKLKEERAPLTDKYGSFIVPSDTRLKEARTRLHTALEQTRQLRAAFTDRVYGKYRVCLHRPASTEQNLTRILTDPQTTANRLEEEILILNEEKTWEKKEAVKLNSEMMAALHTSAASEKASASASTATTPASSSSTTAKTSKPTTMTTATSSSAANTATSASTASSATAKPSNNSSGNTAAAGAASAASTTTEKKSEPPMMMNPLEVMNAENAEQLMYISAGLSLIVLPEQDATGLDMSQYRDRAPIHSATGQRVKGISAAAAAAGDVMLDRARKGAAMRAERIRRKNSSKESNNYSRLEFLSKNPMSPPPPPMIVPSAKPAAVKVDVAATLSASASGNANSSTATTATTATAAAKAPSATTTAAESVTLKKAPPAVAAAKAAPAASSAKSSSGSGAAAKSSSSTSSGTKRPLPKSSSTSPAAAAAATSSIPSAAAAKAIRARVQATMSVQTLLSLSPSGEELRTDGKLSAATLALMERGVGTQGQNTKAHQHQRYRHPHPDSQGGRRRSLQSSSSSNKQDQLLHPAYTALTLPPLPTSKERRTRKRLPQVVTDPNRMGSQRAKKAIQNVLEQFNENSPRDDATRPIKRRRRMSEISFLHGIQDFNTNGESSKVAAADKKTTEPTSSSSSTKLGDMDPMLAFHVMQAVGLIQPLSSVDKDDDYRSSSEAIFPANLETDMFSIAEKRAMGDEGGVSRRSISKLQNLHKKFTSSQQSFSRRIFNSPSMTEKSKALTKEGLNAGRSEEQSRPQESSSQAQQVPVVPIRGGGEALNGNGDSSNGNNGAISGIAANPAENSASEVSKSDLAASSRPAAGHQTHLHSPQANMWGDPSRLVLMNPGMGAGHASNMARLSGHLSGAEHFHPNAIQLANQLRLSRMPAQGHHGGADLAEYLGGLHPQSPSGYEWAAVGAASAAAASAQSFAALGIAPHALVNFPLQDRARAMMRDQTAASAAAAHAAVAHRHQQALAYLSGGHGYPAGGSPHFAHMGGGIMNPSVAFMGQTGTTPVPMQAQAQQSGGKQGASADPAPRLKNPTKTEPKVESTEGSSKEEKPSASSNVKKEMSGKPSVGSTALDNETEKDKGSKKRKTPEEEVVSSQPEKQARTGEMKSTAVSLPTPTASKKAADDGDSSAAKPSREDTGDGSQVASDRAPALKSAPSKGKEKDSTPSVSAVNNGLSGTIPSGLQFFVPPAPPEVPTDIASLVLQGRCQEAVKLAGPLAQSQKSSLVGYFCTVGTAVPIPKTLVANLLKERLNVPPLKSTVLGSIPQSSRDAAVATILLWLWKCHEQCFQRAFVKSGRIDVEPECKWLVSAAVEKAASSLGQALEDKSSRSSTPLAISLMAIKSKGSSSQKTNQDKGSESFVTARLDLLVVSIVSKGLLAGLKVNAQADASLPNFNDMLDYLDETRKCALHSKSQERALLAALISRKATMSLSFSHAYVSSMVRAGEALGHGDLFEVVQNEEVNVSTMIPYDVFTDETGAWEDPCRPPNGFNANLTGDDLMRQAHARAMIQKSLKKLQDRHNIKGGTQVPGAYTDPPNAGTGSDSKASANSSGGSTPRGWLKRRSSFSEPPVQPGTGSGAATSWALYDPKHFSAPLEWKPDHMGNTPYGKHNSATRPRSLSLSQFSLKLPSKGRGKRSASVGVSSFVEPIKEPKPDDGPVKRSTREIPWVDVAGIFQNVALQVTPKQPEVPVTPRGRTIFAPYVREVDFEDVDAISEDESDEEEDLRDEMVLGRHQVVLDRMKEHLSTFLAARQTTQEKKKSRSSKT
jgi:hypothetical protein